MLMDWMRRDRDYTNQYADRSDAWGSSFGAAPQEEQGAAIAEGMVAGTLIATEMGWRPVEALAAGDMVLTFDNHSAQVLDVVRDVLWSGRGVCPKALWPLAVPAGVLGNRLAMMVLPEQNVMIESDIAEVLFADPFALVPAAALEGYRGIVRVNPYDMIHVVTLRFAQDQVVYANGAGMVHCAGIDGFGLMEPASHGCNYAPLTLDRARRLVAVMIEDDASAGNDRATAMCAVA